MADREQRSAGEDERAKAEHGRHAERPAQIPRRGWWDVLKRTGREVKEDNVSIVAAGVAYYSFLAIFPALTALVFLWGLVADPGDIDRQLASFAGVLPGDAQQMLHDQLTRLASQSHGSLGIGALASLAVALWSAGNGIGALITALNIAYDQQETRGFFRLTGLRLLLTVGGIVFVLVALGAVVVVPALFSWLGLSGIGADLVRWLRWPFLAAAVLGGLAVLYHVGASRTRPRWRWVSPGAVVATVLWLLGSVGFSFYVSHFGKYNQTYGSVGAIVILLTWFLLSAYVVILGAELNGELERQTVKDTTVGPPEPIGRRGAYPADTVGEPA
jgi:membrane protein